MLAPLISTAMLRIMTIDQQSDEYFNEHAVQCGRMLGAAAYFDDALTIFIAKYLELNVLQENALLRPMSTRAKVDLMAKISRKFLDVDSEKQMRGWFSEARGCLDERNAVVHGVPAQIDGRFAYVSWTGKNRLDPAPDPWPIERVCELANRFVSLTDFLQQLVEGLELSKDYDLDRGEK